MTQTPEKCKHCQRSSLSLLLLRPSVVSKDERLAPAGGSAVAAGASVNGLVPARALVESRYVLRLLRKGYVHVFIPKPPKGVAAWHVHRVSENGDLVAQNNPIFINSDAPRCTAAGHNNAGMKLLQIPQAHEIKTIWIAFSANLWGDGLRKRNAQNPRVMQQVTLGAEAANTFKPTAEALTSKVLECALSAYRHKGVAQDLAAAALDFAFCSLSGAVVDLASQLERAAACNPATQGKELAVVLRDPAALAAELNTIRLWRHAMGETALAAPELEQPRKVNQAILTLQQSLISKAELGGLSKIVPLIHREKYERERSSYPAGTTWQALTDEERAAHQESFDKGNWLGRLVAGPAMAYLQTADLGRVLRPGYVQQLDAWAKKEGQEQWQQFHEFYDENKRRQWQRDLEKRHQAQHLDPLQRCEQDWDAALNDPLLLNYFGYHFDEGDGNDPARVARTGCCAGAVYVAEAAAVFTPEPKTPAAIETFNRQIDADVTKADAVLLRAMFANQASLWETLESDKPDKVVDFFKGLIKEVEAHATQGEKILAPPLARRLGWLTQATMGFSLTLMGTIAAVATQGVHQAWSRHALAATRQAFRPDPLLLQRLTRAEAMTWVHRACEEALKAPAGAAVKVPVLITANVSLETYVQIKRSRGEMLSMREIRGLAGKGQLTLAILSDTETLRDLRLAGGNATYGLAQLPAATVHINQHALQLKAAAQHGGMLSIPVSRFMPIYEKQLQEAAKVPSALQRMGRQTKLTMLSIDGRLAVGTMVVQGLGAWKGISQYLNTTDPAKQFDAILSISDGIAGLIGGAADMGAKFMEVRLGAAAANNKWLAAPRLVGAVMGIAGNSLNAWMCMREADRLRAQGQVALSNTMKSAGMVFGMGAVPLAIQAAHQLQILFVGVERAAGGVLARAVAARIPTAVVGLTVPGLGWALTVVAVGQTIYVVMNTPTPMQTWLKYSYFGKLGDGEQKRASWAEEDKAWKELVVGDDKA